MRLRSDGRGKNWSIPSLGAFCSRLYELVSTEMNGGRTAKHNATKPTEKSLLRESVHFSCSTNELYYHYFQFQIRTLEEPRKYGEIRTEWVISFCSLDDNL
jgi:hypothetical protein